jgi:hypothetical protein
MKVNDLSNNKSKGNNKQYCILCNKKLPIFAIQCKCNKLYCSIHRYPDEHGCQYNYKEEYKKELIKKNKIIISNKVNKI